MTYIPLIGRILLAVIFILAGFNKIQDFSGSVTFAATGVGESLATVAIVVAIIVELLGGLMLLVGYRTKWAAWTIAIFLVPVTLLFHTDFSSQIQMTMFLKNAAMIGGLLYVATFGAGAVSMDARKSASHKDVL